MEKHPVPHYDQKVLSLLLQVSVGLVFLGTGAGIGLLILSQFLRWANWG